MKTIRGLILVVMPAVATVFYFLWWLVITIVRRYFDIDFMLGFDMWFAQHLFFILFMSSAATMVLGCIIDDIVAKIRKER